MENYTNRARKREKRRRKVIKEYCMDWHGYGAQTPHDPIVPCPECHDDCFEEELEEYGMCELCWEKFTNED